LKKIIENKKVYIIETISIINKPGALLVSKAINTNPNIMAIGWGTIGFIWKKPVFIVLVRPSRYTYELIIKSGEFTVNIPYPSMKNIVDFSGSHSGRKIDKFKKLGLIQIPSRSINVPIIQECAINYECRVLHYNEVNPAILPPEIINEYYHEDDYHRVFFGEILTVHADEPFKEKLL